MRVDVISKIIFERLKKLESIEEMIFELKHMTRILESVHMRDTDFKTEREEIYKKIKDSRGKFKSEELEKVK